MARNLTEYQLPEGANWVSLVFVQSLDSYTHTIILEPPLQSMLNTIATQRSASLTEATTRSKTPISVFANTTMVSDQEKTINLNKVERRDITISLLNEKHEPVITWRVHNAFPVKVQASDLKADGNEVAIETLELAHEGLDIVS